MKNIDYPFISYYMIEPVGNQEKENNMANNWFEMVKEGHFYAIDDEGNVVDFGKACICEIENCTGCLPEVTLRLTPIKVMKNEGASAHSFERECVEYHALKAANEENKKLIEKLKMEIEDLKARNLEFKKEKQHIKLAYTDLLFERTECDSGLIHADNDPKAVYLSTGRRNGKTQMLKEMLNSMYGNKALKFEIKKVIFSGPCTIVFWEDGTKTMVRQQENDILDHEKGLAMAIAKKVYGNKSNYNNVLKRWLVGEDWRKKERLAKKLAKATDDICDLVENKASDEELKEAIDESKEIIDKMKE